MNKLNEQFKYFSLIENKIENIEEIYQLSQI